MGLSNWFGWQASGSSDELPEIFPMAIPQIDFVAIDVLHIYARILVDVLERTHGLKEEHQDLMSDNCLMSESNDGLVTRLARAMTDKKDLFLVYEKALKVIRVATHSEEQAIRADYKKSGESKVGVFVSFKNYKRSDMVKLYSSFKYSTVSALYKSTKLSSAIQVKVNDLRASVSLNDSSDAKAQAVAIAVGLGEGKDVLLDAKDTLETATPDMEAANKSSEFIEKALSFYLGLPFAYITGEQTGGLGTTGENDTKATERGLKNYFDSIIKPVMFALFGVKVTYKSQDFRQITQGLETLKTFELTSEQYISAENKKRIVEGIFDLDPDDNETEDPPEIDPMEVVNEPGKPNGKENVPPVQN